MIPGRIPSSLLGALLQLSMQRPIFTADYYAIDTGTGKVGSFIDWNNPTHVIAQGSGTNQVAIPAAHADFGNKLCITSTSTLQFYQSNQSAASFSYGSDGSGICSWAVVGASTYTGFAPIGLGTCDLSSPANGAGISLFHQNATGFRAAVSNGSAYCVNHTSGAGGVPVGASRVLVDIRGGQNPVSALYRNGVLLSTSALTGAFNLGAPKTSLILGAVAGANGYIQRRRAWGWLPSIGSELVPAVDSILAQV